MNLSTTLSALSCSIFTLKFVNGYLKKKNGGEREKEKEKGGEGRVATKRNDSLTIVVLIDILLHVGDAAAIYRALIKGDTL